MCGIMCEICGMESKFVKDDQVLALLKNRGPDCFHAIETEASGHKIFFCGAVLHTQGSEPVIQPIENDQTILLFNGDIFDSSWDKNISDTLMLMQKISKTFKNGEQLFSLFRKLKGPFSLIVYDKLNNELYFMRDRLGRNSLLFHKSESSCIISSVLSRNFECIEVPASHMYKLKLNTRKIEIHSWTSDVPVIENTLEDWLNSVQKIQALPDEEFGFQHIPFNLELNDEVLECIQRASNSNADGLSFMKNILENENVGKIVKQIESLLAKSVKIRLETQPNKCQDCLMKKNKTCSHSAVGILFSGGLDCTVLALLANRYVPINQSIDLINVAFKKGNSENYDVPDRLTGRHSYEELKKLCPSRNWVLKEVNVPIEELKKLQLLKIADLIHPRHTILDESLGSALWFAARGFIDHEPSPCRILLLGSGADELFGGYVRHRNALKRNGWVGLTKELQLDWERISVRNLARDNRVICDHGRQPRMPYLDEDFANFILNLNPWLKCVPSESLGPGVTDKLALRLVALSLGFSNLVTLPKRALQFGSKIANKKERGCDISKTFLKFN